MKILRILALVAIVSFGLTSCEKTQQVSEGEAYLIELRNSDVEPFNTISKEEFESLVNNSVFDETTFKGIRSYSEVVDQIGVNAFQLSIQKLTGSINKNVTITKFEELKALGRINADCIQGKYPDIVNKRWDCVTGGGCCIE